MTNFMKTYVPEMIKVYEKRKDHSQSTMDFNKARFNYDHKGNRSAHDKKIKELQQDVLADYDRKIEETLRSSSI